ncbi:nitrous oxide reductase accessory protein NosL [Magnetococcus sp. PR-3]|uniref:nitrous oxide reductase accessory protein NosL n=1 Tax=Magnetococcus sp. PR-3 TaxID=3120355 RepID=UPI002FCE245D
MNRRKAMQMLAAMGAGVVTTSHAVAGGMIKPWEWVQKRDTVKNTDGTPLQFEPKGQPDPHPEVDDITKYPRCPYCGMSRHMWNHSRHLIHYSDGLADGTCSLHCASVSLSLNLDRVPKAIYAADFGAKGKMKPLINIDHAFYLIGSQLRGTMSTTSKMAFQNETSANRAHENYGGKLAKFNEALTQSYLDMANDTIMIRKRREKMRQSHMGMKHH